MPPVEAVTLIVVPTLATNAWQFFTGASPTAVARRQLTSASEGSAPSAALLELEAEKFRMR
jgi:hypothetical protein